MMIRVAIADDETMLVDGIDAILRDEAGIEIVGRSADSAATLAAVRDSRAEVLLIGQHLRNGNSTDVIRQLRQEQSPCAVVLLATSVHSDEVIELMRLGVAGILMKTMPARLLVQCVRKVAAGGKWLENESFGRAVDQLLRSHKKSEHSSLSARELDVVREVGRGLRNREIAQRLFISESTVKVHMNNIFDKLQVGSRVQVSIYAQQNGLV